MKTETKAKKVELLSDKCDMVLESISDTLKHIVYCEFKNKSQLEDYTLSMRKIKDAIEQLRVVENTLVKKLVEGAK